MTNNMGWQCPCCRAVYAPHINSCLCQSNMVPQQEAERGLGYDDIVKKNKTQANPLDPMRYGAAYGTEKW